MLDWKSLNLFRYFIDCTQSYTNVVPNSSAASTNQNLPGDMRNAF